MAKVCPTCGGSRQEWTGKVSDNQMVYQPCPGCIPQDQAEVCPNCGSVLLKAIYMGAPLRVCSDITCNTVLGIGGMFASALPTPGGWSFMVYEGSYWSALWRWLTRDDDVHDDVV